MSGLNGRQETSPSYDWYPRDWWANKKVARLTPLERDAYRTLLDEAWLYNGVDPTDLQSIAEGRKIRRRDIDRVVALFFVADEHGKLRDDRLERERATLREITELKRAAGAKGGRQTQQRLSSAQAVLSAAKQPASTAEPSPLLSSPLSASSLRSEADLASSLRSEARPRSGRARRRPAEPWALVLERPEYALLRQSPAFVAAWERWIAWTRTAGARAREPLGQQAAAILNRALEQRADLASWARDVECAIAGNWQGIHVGASKARGAAEADGKSSFDFEAYERDLARRTAGGEDDGGAPVGSAA